MKSFLKWSAIIIGCLAAVIIAAMLLIPMFVDVQKYKPMLESKVTDATGRSFSVGDDLSLSLFPWAGVSLSDLRLGSPAGFAEKEFVTVKSFEVRVKLLPLISKDIQIKRFVVNEPRIHLVTDKHGRANWEQPELPKQPAKDTPSQKEEKSPAEDTGGFDLPISALTVGNLSINNGSAIWDDRQAGMRREISQINLALKDVSLERPVALTFSALADQKPISIEGTVGPIGQGFQAKTIPVELSLKALKQLAMRLKGSLENPLTNPGVDMDIEIDPFSPRKLVAELGEKFPVKTSDPEALNSIALKTHVKADAGKIALSDGTMSLDQSKLKFSAAASDFSRPNLQFDLNLDQIDLDRYLPPPSDQPPAEKPSAKAQSSAKKPDYTPLRRMIVDGTAKIGQLTASKARVQDVLLQIKAKDGIIKLDPIKLNMYQGNADGRAVLNVVKNTPKSDLNLRINDIQVNPLLKDVLEKDFLEGRTNADINLSMIGDVPEQIKKTLTGSGDLRFNDGAIVGIDLASMARNIKSAFGMGSQQGGKRPRTDFTELAIPFTIKNGVTNTPGSSLKSPFIRIIAAGTADLVQETLDFRVEPKAVASIKGQGDATQRSGLMVPVLVSGSFASPKFRPDLSAAAKQNIEKQILESKEAQDLLQKEELKPLEKSVKGTLKGILGN
jgi:AsmA protein